MAEYWSSRLDEAIRKSRTASTLELRRVHLQTAAHYRSLLEFCLPHENPVRPDRLAA